MDKDLSYVNKGGEIMERLTERDSYGDVYVKQHDYVTASEKLAEYEDLEEQGLLLRLPCKVGDCIYRVNTGAKEPIIKMRVLAVNYKQFYKDITVIRKDRTVIRIYAINDIDMGESCYLLEDFGKTVFLTQAEAEAKLKELRCNHD